MAMHAKVDGFVAPGFEAVAEQFARNLAERGEVGAAFAAVRDGEPVVDLWGGLADRPARRSWQADTLQLIFSGTKGLVAICLLLLIDRSQLELDAPVAHYWPEFAAAGKEAVTVRQLVTHTGRLPGLATTVSAEELVDDVRVAQLLAAQPQFEDSRARLAYHPLTYGWLCGELVRRIDGRSVGRFFAEELAAPLGLEVFIGLPERLEPRVSRLELAEGWGITPALREDATEPDALVHAIFHNPWVWGGDRFPWNDRSYHAAEIPGAGGIGTARSIAKLYGSLDQLISPALLERARTVLERRHDPLLDEPQAFGIGFELQTERMPFGPVPDAYGHGGAGGSAHGAWPEQRVGFSYAMNLMRDDAPDGDPRPKALLGALHACIGEAPLAPSAMRECADAEGR